MVGGGRGAFIGPVHRMAATLDGEAEFVAGCLSSTPERAIESGREAGLKSVYGTWEEMVERERALPAGERIDAAVIVTPNHLHATVAAAFAKAGINVVCDKPLTRTLAEAEELEREVSRTGVVFCVTYNYTGYPLVRAMREMVRGGQLGAVRRVAVEYYQGWLATNLAAEGQKQAAWRADPALAGAGALGDIGTHAENLMSFVTGLEVESLCADVRSAVAGRTVDDDASVLLRFRGGARGVLTASQVCVGEENGLAIRVYGERGSVAWRQENPNELRVSAEGEATRVLTRAGAGGPAGMGTRLPSGHPEGFIEAFANVYRWAFGAIRARREGKTAAGEQSHPTIVDGVRGVRFVERCLASKGAWVDW